MSFNGIYLSFGSFGEHSVNPSWLAVKALSNIWDGPSQLITKEIPVAYKYVKEEIPSMLDKFQPQLVIHVGVSSLVPGQIQLETCAHSNGYIRPDVHGCCGPLATSDTQCLVTSLDVNTIVKECSCVTMPCIVKSVDAGRYLCEYIFYTSLQTNSAPVLFVHVPVLEENTVTVETLAAALKTIIQSCLRQINS